MSIMDAIFGPIPNRDWFKDMSDLDDRLKAMDKESLPTAWQNHRVLCLKLAIKLGATSAEQAIEIAEKLSSTYILRPPGPLQTPDAEKGEKR